MTVFAEKTGYPYLTAQNGLEAVDLYKRAAQTQHPRLDEPIRFANSHRSLVASKPDVILMDINMPGIDGFEAARRIRDFEYEIGASAAKIVALTGLGNPEAHDRSVACGMNLFLTKPVRLKALKNLLVEIEARESEEKVVMTVPAGRSGGGDVVLVDPLDAIGVLARGPL